MKLTVIRTDLLPGMTRGLLDVDGEFFGHTLEDEDLQLELYPTRKKYGETAIPRGNFKMVLDFSARFKVTMPHVLGVPGFDGVRIHPGNTTADTHGCILIGMVKTDTGVGRSREAYERLMDKILGATELTLEVV